jgi:hypothetical protein
MKRLQGLLQGSILAQVNEGPIEFCQKFLGNVERYSSVHVEKLKTSLKDFLSLCEEAITINDTLIGEDQRPFQVALEQGLSKLKGRMEPYVGAVGSLTTSGSGATAASASNPSTPEMTPKQAKTKKTPKTKRKGSVSTKRHSKEAPTEIVLEEASPAAVSPQATAPIEERRPSNAIPIPIVAVESLTPSSGSPSTPIDRHIVKDLSEDLKLADGDDEEEWVRIEKEMAKKIEEEEARLKEEEAALLAAEQELNQEDDEEDHHS